MFLQKLHLVNFKNYTDAALLFDEGVNCFVGDNGSGKTNLLDAIHYLALCKSAFNPIDSQNVKHEQDIFVLQGHFSEGDHIDTVYCGFKRNEKKQFKLNQKEYPRLADHIGRFPVVLISPEDSILITGGSEERRKLFDSIIAQFDSTYLDNLINYNKVLLQRNTLLKQFASSGRFDKQMLDVWDEQLVQLGRLIFERRASFVEGFVPIFKKYFEYLSEGREEAGVDYQSSLNEHDFATLLSQAIDKDRFLQYTTVGIHKDDLVFKLDGFAVKKFGSQGQQKSFLTALKLAQFEYIKTVKKSNPLLLLDDVFDKLDERRLSRLMELVSGAAFGQIFLTDSHPDRAVAIFRKIKVKPKVFFVQNGEVSETNKSR